MNIIPRELPEWAAKIVDEGFDPQKIMGAVRVSVDDPALIPMNEEDDLWIDFALYVKGLLAILSESTVVDEGKDMVQITCDRHINEGIIGTAITLCRIMQKRDELRERGFPV